MAASAHRPLSSSTGNSLLTAPKHHDHQAGENASHVRGQIGEMDFALWHKILQALQCGRVDEHGDCDPAQPAPPQYSAKNDQDTVGDTMENQIVALEAATRQLHASVGVEGGDGNDSAGQDEAEEEQNSPTAGSRQGLLCLECPVGPTIGHRPLTSPIPALDSLSHISLRVLDCPRYRTPGEAVFARNGIL